jgi:hypothetical protein
MMKGPEFKVIVGATEKEYTLPRDILCHYSDYFRRCFHGSFMEAKTQELNLDSDNVEWFEVLLEYMLFGRATTPPSLSTCHPSITLDVCLDFLEYADKYNLGSVCDVVYDPLRAAFTSRFHTPNPISIDQADRIFRIAPKGSRIRPLVAEAIISSKGIQGVKAHIEKYSKIEGLEGELLGQILGKMTSYVWTDSLTTSSTMINRTD